MKRSFDADLTIEFKKDDSMMVHSVVLALASPVFKTMLTSGMTEETTWKITLPGQEMQHFQTVYNMLQAETAVPLTVGNVLDVISITHEYQISKIHNAAVSFLKERVQSCEICGPAYVIAKRLDIKLILDVMQLPSFHLQNRLGSFLLNDVVFELLPTRLTDEQI